MHPLFYWLYAHDRLRQGVELEMPARRSGFSREHHIYSRGAEQR